MSKYAVCALTIHPDTGHVLACTRRGTTDQWGLIGGKVDEDETHEDAVCREFREETGFPCRLMYGEPIFGMLDDHGYNTTVWSVYADSYLRNAFPSNTPKEVEPGILVGWVPYVWLLQGPFAEFNSQLLNKYLAESTRL